jgi:hypothetical protein
MTRRAVLQVLPLLIAAGLLAPEVRAESPRDPQIVELRAGFDGHFKVGCWTPFEITLEGGHDPVTGQLELIVADCDGVPSRVQTLPTEGVSLEAGVKTTVTLFAKVGQLASGATVRFRDSGDSLPTERIELQQPGPFAGILPSSSRLIVTLGGPLASFDQSHFEQRGVTVVDLPGASALPKQWWGLEGVDAVMLATGGDERDPLLTTDSPQLAALDQWVRMGGTLVISAGRNAEALLADGMPLTRLAPGHFAELVERVPSAPLETYADSPDPIAGGTGRFLVDVGRLSIERGKVLAYAGSGPRNLPLVVRAAHGFGEVWFLAADLERPPLVSWPGRMPLVDRLLGAKSQGMSRGEDEVGGQVTTLGFVDLSGQLRGALDQFAGVRLVPFWLVALLAVAYIACIGPLDYFLVKRVFRRMEATWITFGVTVVAFCAGAYFLAYGLKGRELRANRVELVDFDAESQWVRGTSWANLFSPASAAYDLSIDPTNAVPQAQSPPQSLFSWMGLPGDGFGGMNPTSASVPMFTLPYDFAPRLDALHRVPIAIWSTRPFVGRWWTDAAPPIEAALSDDGRLSGTIECHLTAPLERAVLIYDTWAYPLNKLEPGQFIDIAHDLDPQTVETYLRQVTVRGDRDVVPPYDQSSFDVPRIVEVMSCHELAGGSGYTGLEGTYQEFVDLSHLVADGRAILIGRQATSATRLICAGEPLDDPDGQHWTFYRFVFPVSRPLDR